jgi:hypothetical protein
MGVEASHPPLSEERRLFELLTRQGEWIHRRVDRTDIAADGETTRRLSFDLTVRDAFKIEYNGGVVAPLTLMTKVPLRRLDTSGPDGRPLPVLGRQDNGNLVRRMLIEAFRGVAEGDVPANLEDAVRAAVMERDPLEMGNRMGNLAEVTARLRTRDPDQVDAVLALASDLTQQFLFAVLLPKELVDNRVVIKVAVTEDVDGSFPDWAFARDGRSMDLPLSLVDAAASAHFEFRAPLGLKVASVRLLDDLGEEVSAPGPAVREGRTAHLTGLERLNLENGNRVRARVELEPVADGFVRQTAWATTFVAILLFAGAWNVDQLRTALLANRAGSVAAAALAVPALFLSVQSRRPEHSWVARALFVPRLLNIATATLLYVAAVYLVVVQPETSSVRSALWILFGLQVVLAAVAIVLLRVVSVETSTVRTDG